MTTEATQKEIETVDEFESYVRSQKQVDVTDYDRDYFTDEWRKNGNSYMLETRRAIEGRNPALIKEVFSPAKVLDMGCGPGSLMQLLHELGVEVDGIDGSPSSPELAPPAVRGRIRVGQITEDLVPASSYDLVICREVLEHLTVLQVRRAVAAMCRATSKYVYMTTRYHPAPASLLSVTTQFDVDPTHITLLNMEFMRVLFVLEGMRRRPDLEEKMDWMRKGRVMVYEKAA